MTITSAPPVAVAENRLLAALSPPDYDRLVGQSAVVSFDLRDIVYQPNGPID